MFIYFWTFLFSFRSVFNIFKCFRFVSLSKPFDIQALLSKNLYYRWNPYSVHMYSNIANPRIALSHWKTPISQQIRVESMNATFIDCREHSFSFCHATKLNSGFHQQSTTTPMDLATMWKPATLQQKALMLWKILNCLAFQSYMPCKITKKINIFMQLFPWLKGGHNIRDSIINCLNLFLSLTGCWYTICKDYWLLLQKILNKKLGLPPAPLTQAT